MRWQQRRLTAVLRKLASLVFFITKELEGGKYKAKFSKIYTIYNDRFRFLVNIKQEEAISPEQVVCMKEAH